jgi:hypothetical protein
MGSTILFYLVLFNALPLFRRFRLVRAADAS